MLDPDTFVLEKNPLLFNCIERYSFRCYCSASVVVSGNAFSSCSFGLLLILISIQPPIFQVQSPVRLIRSLMLPYLEEQPLAVYSFAFVLYRGSLPIFPNIYLITFTCSPYASTLCHVNELSLFFFFEVNKLPLFFLR
jgi:hypothetical protein